MLIRSMSDECHSDSNVTINHNGHEPKMNQVRRNVATLRRASAPRAQECRRPNANRPSAAVLSIVVTGSGTCAIVGVGTIRSANGNMRDRRLPSVVTEPVRLIGRRITHIGNDVVGADAPSTLANQREPAGPLVLLAPRSPLLKLYEDIYLLRPASSARQRARLNSERLRPNQNDGKFR